MIVAVLTLAILPYCHGLAQSGENFALRRGTFQSSTAYGGYSGLAVDGDSNPRYHDGSCSHTLNGGNEWWAVRLDAITNVTSVVITNRDDCCSGRLKDFVVGLTLTSPDNVVPAAGNYEVCANVTEPLGPGESRTIPCVGSGRYVIIQLLPKEYLTLCEVKINAEMAHLE